MSESADDVTLTPSAFAAKRGLGRDAAAKEMVAELKLAVLSRAQLDRLGYKRRAARRPVNAAAVKAYGIVLPGGYRKSGDTYAWVGDK